MISMLKQFDVNCTHEKYCSEYCFDRVYRQCNRLRDAFKLIYEGPTAGKTRKKIADRRKQLG